MRIAILCIVIMMAGCLVVGSAPALATPISIDLSTGLNLSGTVETTDGANDAYWKIDSQPAGVVVPQSVDWYPGFPADDARSAWIAKDPGSYTNNGLGTYTRTFDLTAVDLESVSISGIWSVADQGFLSLNGNQIATQAWDGWYSFETQTFSVTDPSWFNPGLNTLSMTITNADYFYEGVRMNAAVGGQSVPEPGPLSIVVFAGVTLLGHRSRRIPTAENLSRIEVKRYKVSGKGTSLILRETARSNETGKCSGVTCLVNYLIPVWINKKHAIAHNKVTVIDGDTATTGSFNFTPRNDEMATPLLNMTSTRCAPFVPLSQLKFGSGDVALSASMPSVAENPFVRKCANHRQPIWL